MQRIKLFSTVSWLLCIVLGLVATEVSAGVQQGFSNASLKGSYASMGIGRGGIDPVAGMTKIIADGKGKFVGKTVINRPYGKYEERKVVTFPIEGTYHIEKDGSGTIEIFPPADISDAQTGHFMITQANIVGQKNKKRRATELAFILDELLPNSSALQTSVLKRLPKNIDFNQASFKGTYASMGIGRGGIDPAAGMTTITADGKGGFVGKTVFNRPYGKSGSRTVVTFPIKGTYYIEKDGAGTLKIFLPAEIGETQTGHFMVTQARRVNGYHKKYLATEVSFVLDELLPNSAALQTTELKRLPD